MLKVKKEVLAAKELSMFSTAQDQHLLSNSPNEAFELPIGSSNHIGAGSASFCFLTENKNHLVK
jgi:hypothetical protein